MAEEFAIHRVGILGMAESDHYFLGDMTESNKVTDAVEDEDESDFAAVITLLNLVRDLDEDHVLVLRKEVK